VGKSVGKSAGKNRSRETRPTAKPPTLEVNRTRRRAIAQLSTTGDAMSYDMHTSPIPDPNADPTRDPEGDPLTPPSPGHHNDEPQRPEGPPDKDPV
jgi:hypothetical protein